jgi:hypothetical protein
MKRLYILRVRTPDGEWVVDPIPRTSEEVNTIKLLNRIDGVVTQVWTLAEAKKMFGLKTAKEPTPAGTLADEPGGQG